MPTRIILPTDPALQTQDANASYVELLQGVKNTHAIQNPASIIPASERIDLVRVVWSARDLSPAQPDEAHAGLRKVIGGAFFFGPVETFDFSGFALFSHELTTDPSTGLAWTIESLGGFNLASEATIVSGSPMRLTYIVIEVQTTDLRGLKGRASSQSPRAAVSSIGPAAAAKSQAPAAALKAQGSGTRLTGQSPRATAVSAGPTVTLSGRAPRVVTPPDLPTLRVTFSSQGPRVSVAPQSPQTALANRPPKAEGS